MGWSFPRGTAGEWGRCAPEKGCAFARGASRRFRTDFVKNSRRRRAEGPKRTRLVRRNTSRAHPARLQQAANPASIDRDRLPRDVGRLLRGEERRQRRELAWLADAAHG